MIEKFIRKGIEMEDTIVCPCCWSKSAKCILEPDEEEDEYYEYICSDCNMVYWWNWGRVMNLTF